jgi:uncharacterized membrane protein
MSTVSQTPARRPMGYRTSFALSMVVVAGVVGLSLSGAWSPIAQMALSARPHLPDMALFAAQSLAIKIHLATALTALALGGALMWRRKGRLFHRVAGWAWVSLVSVTAGSTLFITSLNHGKWSLLHLFTGWVLLILPLAVMWAKRHNVARHRRAMMGLFYGGFAINLLVAFIPGRLLWTMLLG